MKDLIVGAFLGYLPPSLVPWVNSIRRSGFSGDKLALVYGLDVRADFAADFLQAEGFIVERPGPYPASIVVERFRDIVRFLDAHPGLYRHVIATDVGDVVFQREPSPFLEARLRDGKEILVGSECVRFADQPWGRDNLLRSFPDEAHAHLDDIIYNAGVIAATAPAARELFAAIYAKSISSPIANPDQAALNLLLQGPFKPRTVFASLADGWALHCGTTLSSDAGTELHQLFVEPAGEIRRGVGYTPAGDPVCILHQYTRDARNLPQVHRRYRAPGRLGLQFWKLRFLSYRARRKLRRVLTSAELHGPAGPS
jgi:hypothetical protein